MVKVFCDICETQLDQLAIGKAQEAIAEYAKANPGVEQAIQDLLCEKCLSISLHYWQKKVNIVREEGETINRRIAKLRREYAMTPRFEQKKLEVVK